MGSSKCSLRKEVKNEIAKYIDSEFTIEMIKEIVNYIRTTHRVKIDDSSFDKYNPESKVTLKDNGPFNIYDYMYVKDFLYELSWEGSYVEALEEIEFSNESKDKFKNVQKVNKGVSKYIPKKNATISEIVYKYVPKDIAAVLYEKVEKTMELKKGELYKSFKKRYNTEYLFNSVRWYKRTRDGKVYYDIDLQELDDNKRVRLEEQIKTEIGNGYKSRWGSHISAKVISLEDKLLLDVYNEGCKLLEIPNEYSTEIVKEENSYNEEILAKLMIENCKEAAKDSKGINRLKVKVVNSIDSKLNNLNSINIYKTDDHMKLFLENAREMIFGYYKSVNLKGFNKALIAKEDDINKLIRRVAVVENIIYEKYLEENPKAPSIDDMEDFEECIPWICTKGLIWTSENIYIKNKVKDEIEEIILDSPIDEYEEARRMKRHFYLHVGETNTGKTYASIQKLMDAESGVYLAPLRLLALEVQDKLRGENIACSLLTGEEEDIISYASHISSTIEKLQIETHYDICVIDEAQMIAD